MRGVSEYLLKVSRARANIIDKVACSDSIAMVAIVCGPPVVTQK